jgi:hypothetical protein
MLDWAHNPWRVSAVESLAGGRVKLGREGAASLLLPSGGYLRLGLAYLFHALTGCCSQRQGTPCSGGPADMCAPKKNVSGSRAPAHRSAISSGLATASAAGAKAASTIDFAQWP